MQINWLGAKFIKVILFVLLLFFAYTKIGVDGSRPLLFPGEVYWVFILIEFALGVFLFTRYEVIACILIACMAFVGAALAVLFPEKDCGCLGSLGRFSLNGHLIAASTIGLLASLILINRDICKT